MWQRVNQLCIINLSCLPCQHSSRLHRALHALDAAVKAFEQALHMHKTAIIRDRLAHLGFGLLIKSLLAAALLQRNQVRMPSCVSSVCLLDACLCMFGPDKALLCKISFGSLGVCACVVMFALMAVGIWMCQQCNQMLSERLFASIVCQSLYVS